MPLARLSLLMHNVAARQQALAAAFQDRQTNECCRLSRGTWHDRHRQSRVVDEDVSGDWPEIDVGLESTKSLMCRRLRRRPHVA